jgi:hypothetical protein
MYPAKTSEVQENGSSLIGLGFFIVAALVIKPVVGVIIATLACDG